MAREISPDQIGQVNGQNYGLIFDGDIRFTVTGKDNITDSRVLIQAIGDHEAFLYATTIPRLPLAIPLRICTGRRCRISTRSA